MAVTYTLNYLLKDSNGNVLIDQQVSLSAGLQLLLDESIANSTTDGQVAFALDFSQAKLLYILADGVCTIETNSGSTPDDTFTMAANEPIVWTNLSQLTNPIGTDITTDIFVTNSSGASVRLRIWCLVDPTA